MKKQSINEVINKLSDIIMTLVFISKLARLRYESNVSDESFEFRLDLDFGLDSEVELPRGFKVIVSGETFRLKKGIVDTALDLMKPISVVLPPDTTIVLGN
jgi:hypothetical protein